MTDIIQDGAMSQTPPNEVITPEDAKVSLSGEILTDTQRIENLERIIASFIPSVEKVLGVYRDEIIKTQKFVIASLERGTKNQQKLLVPPQYRKPYIRTEEPIGDTPADQEYHPTPDTPGPNPDNFPALHVVPPSEHNQEGS